MPRVRFLRRYDARPTPLSVQTFQANDEKLVTQVVAEQAIKDGAAVLVEEKAPDAPRQGIAETIAAKTPTRRTKKAEKGGG